MRASYSSWAYTHPNMSTVVPATLGSMNNVIIARHAMGMRVLSCEETGVRDQRLRWSLLRPDVRGGSQLD